MSKLCSRYGRRSNWFKIQYSISEYQERCREATDSSVAAAAAAAATAAAMPGPSGMSLSAQNHHHHHHHYHHHQQQQQQQQQHQQQQQQHQQHQQQHQQQQQQQQQQRQQGSNDADWNLPSTSRDTLKQEAFSRAFHLSLPPTLDGASLCRRLSWHESQQRAREMGEVMAQSHLSITPPSTPRQIPSPATATSAMIHGEMFGSPHSFHSFSEYLRDSRIRHYQRSLERSDSDTSNDDSDQFPDCESDSNWTTSAIAFNGEQRAVSSARVPINGIPMQGVPSKLPVVFSPPGMSTPEVHTISPREGDLLHISPNFEQPIDLSVRTRMSDDMNFESSREREEKQAEHADEAATIPLDLSLSGATVPREKLDRS